MEKEFIIEELDCARCAMKTEDGVKKIKGVVCASMNFATQTLVIETENSQGIDAVIAEIHIS